jgi:hypothetical protein
MSSFERLECKSRFGRTALGAANRREKTKQHLLDSGKKETAEHAPSEKAKQRASGDFAKEVQPPDEKSPRSLADQPLEPSMAIKGGVELPIEKEKSNPTRNP